MKLLDFKNKRENKTEQKGQITYKGKKIKTGIRFLKNDIKSKGTL